MEGMISRKDFEKGNFRIRHLGIEDHPVSKLLRKYKRYAFNADTVAKKIKMSKSAVRNIFAGLFKRGLIVKKVPYYMWKKK